MKIKDLLETSSRATIPNTAKRALPPALYSNLDQQYEYYRFLVSIAGFPNTDIPDSGPVDDKPFIVPYSAIERENSIKLLQKLGKNIRNISTDQSCEVREKRNITSPVRTFVDFDKD